MQLAYYSINLTIIVSKSNACYASASGNVKYDYWLNSLPMKLLLHYEKATRYMRTEASGN